MPRLSRANVIKNIRYVKSIMESVLIQSDATKYLTLPDDLSMFPYTWVLEAEKFLLSVYESHEYKWASRVYSMQSSVYWRTMSEQHGKDFESFEEKIVLNRVCIALRKLIFKTRTKLFKKGKRNAYVKSKSKFKSKRTKNKNKSHKKQSTKNISS